MSGFITCNGDGCELQVSKDYAGLWISVSIKMADIDFQADYCPTCWAKEFVRKLAPVVGVDGKEEKEEKKDGTCS